jgi:type IV pilus assembly protein PilP
MQPNHSRSPMHRTWQVVVPLIAAIALAGCAQGTADLEAYAQEVKSRPGPPLDPLPVMQQFEAFEYDAAHLRDPFSAPREERASGAGNGLRPDPNRRRELLESYPLDGLSMVGTLGGESDGLVALVLDPEGVVHRVRVGNYMGQNEGRIVDITHARVDLTELVSDGAGGWMPRQASLALDEK